MKKIPTVTIATIAYNEAENIVRFLESVMMQKEVNFRLKKIVVISDGSTDDTVGRVQSIRSKKITIKIFRKRLGKSARLNWLYRNLNSDYLVQSDADVIYAHSFVVNDLISPLINEMNVAMCGGNPQPLPPKTFIEQAVNCTTLVYSEFRKIIRRGNNIFSADGRILAYKRELVNLIFVPNNMIANDMFTYFCCIDKGYKYRFVISALVEYRSPQTLSDHIRQNTRFRASPIRLEKYFPASLVRKELYISKKMFLAEAMKVFLKYPLHSSVIYMVNLYCRLKAMFVEQYLSAQWQIVTTTKNLNINHE